MKLYKSNVRTAFLFAAETWGTNKKIESRLRGFEGRCIRRIIWELDGRSGMQQGSAWQKKLEDFIDINVKSKRDTENIYVL